MNSVANINDGKWHHVAWTSDGLTEKIYIDGSFNLLNRKHVPGAIPYGVHRL